MKFFRMNYEKLIDFSVEGHVKKSNVYDIKINKYP